MYKSLFLVSVLCLVIIEARPRWQYLPEVPGYVPVYIQNGDTPLEEINPDLAEAFHALPAGRSAGKNLDAAPDSLELSEHVEHADQPQAETAPEPYQSSIDKRPYEALQEKTKKESLEISKPE